MNKKKWRKKFSLKDSRRWLKHHEPVYSTPVLEDGTYKSAISAVLKYPMLKQEKRKAEGERIYRRIPIERFLDETGLGYRERRQYNAVESALMIAARERHNGKMKNLIQARYWSSPITRSLAAVTKELGIPYGRAHQLECRFVALVARELGGDLSPRQRPECEPRKRGERRR